MKLKTALLFAFLALPLAAAAAAPSTGASPKPGETRDASFIQRAGAAGLAEVELSRIALAQAQTPEVKQFAQMMIDAHTASNKELGLIAARQQQRMPAQMDGDHIKLAGRLDGAAGKEFEFLYLRAMVQDHEKMAAMLEQAKGTGSSDVQKFARNTLPVVQEHLEMAKGLAAKSKSK